MFSFKKDDDKISWSIKNTIEGTGPLLIQDGKLCLLARRNYNILVHCLKQVGNPKLGSLEGHEAIVTAMVGHDKNNFIFSGGYDGSVICWNLTTYEKLGQAKLQGYINSLAIDTNNEIVFAGGEDRFICALKLVEI
jgi:WD40 repeat protein